MARVVSRKTGSAERGGHGIVRAAVFMHLVRISAAVFAPVYGRVYSKYQYSIFVPLDIRAPDGHNDGTGRVGICNAVFPAEARPARISLLPHLYCVGSPSFSNVAIIGCFSPRRYCYVTSPVAISALRSKSVGK